MNFCLPKYLVDEFKARIKSGDLSPEKLSLMNSSQRHEYFSSFLGENNATKINALFESKLLLKSQQQGIVNWAKQVAGMKSEVRKDILSKAQKMTKALEPKDLDSFLSDLVEQRLGIGVTMEEAGKISELAKIVAEKKKSAPLGIDEKGKEALEYGSALVTFNKYVGGLKQNADKLSIKELLTSPWDLIQKVSGVAKSTLASFDNSFFGRQGLVALINQPKIWTINFIKSWGDIGRELIGVDVMDGVRASIYARENFRNNKYQDIGIDIGLMSEEAFPDSAFTKIPLLGRFFKASETAYNAAALRIRADIADKLIPVLEAQKVDVRAKDTGLGLLINSMTGRGKLTLTPNQAKAINVTMFSAKYLKSNIDVLTAHYFDRKVMSPEVRRMAANNLLRLIGTLAFVLGMAKFFDDESVELDPLSTDFGKIMVGDNHETKINISAGFGSIITLAARVTPTIREDVFGFWRKNSNGEYVQTNTGEFGVSNAADTIFDFMKGKSSPLAKVLLDTWKGRNFDNEEITIAGETYSLLMPIPVQNTIKILQSDDGADPLAFIILESLDMLGVNVTPERQ